MVQALIIRSGQAFWHESHEIAPDLLHIQAACLRARYRLDINSEALFDPVMLFGDRRKCEVYQLVDDDPVVGELPFRDSATQHDAYRRASMRERGSRAHTGPVDRHDEYLHMVDREAAVISGNGPARGRNPFDDDAR